MSGGLALLEGGRRLWCRGERVRIAGFRDVRWLLKVHGTCRLGCCGTSDEGHSLL